MRPTALPGQGVFGEAGRLALHSLVKYFILSCVRIVNTQVILLTLLEHKLFASIYSDADKLFKVMHRLASSERYYFYQLGLIQEHLMEPLQKAGRQFFNSPFQFYFYTLG